MAKKEKAIDITKTGPQGFRDLQEINALDTDIRPEVLEDIKEIQNRPQLSTYNPYAWGEEDIMSPIGNTKTPRGESRFDESSANQFQFEKLGDIRGENQSGFSKITNGIAKGVILAGTTYLDGTVGLLFGTGTAIAEKRFSGLWDNDFSKAMQQINEAAETAIPNYYTEREQELSRTKPFSAENIFSANFIGDKFLKNIGFTVGAFYSGNTWAKALQATKLPNAIGAAKMARASKAFDIAKESGSAEQIAAAIAKVGRATEAPAIVTSAVGAVMSAMNEGRIEALNNTKDWYELHSAQIQDGIQDQLKLIQDEYDQKKGQLFVDTPAGVVDAAYLEYNEKAKKLQEIYDGSMAKLAEDRAKMGNMDLLMNIPILVASNLAQFSRLYANGYKTARKNVNLVNKSKYGNLSLEEALTRGRAEGVPLDEIFKEYAQFGIKDAKKGVGAYLGNLGKRIGKTALPEGAEEFLQKAASTIAGDYYSSDVHNFYKSKFDPESSEETLSFIKAIAQGMNETWNDGSSWEEFMIGALTGALGMPVFGKANTSAADTYLGKGKKIGLRGGIIGERKEAASQRARNQEIANHLNNTIQSPKFKNYYQGLTRSIDEQKKMNEAAISGDEFTFKNHEYAQLVSDIMMFDNAGKMGDLLTLINAAYDPSPENLASIVKNTSTIVTDDSGKKSVVGPFAKYATINNEGEVVANFGDEAQQKEMADKLTQTKEEIMKTIAEYEADKDEIDILTGQRLTDDQLQELVWIKGQSKNWKERGVKLTDEIRDALIKINQDLSNKSRLVTFLKEKEGAYGYTEREVNGRIVREYGETEAYKNLSSWEKFYLKEKASFDKMLGKSSEDLFLTLGSPLNTKFLENLKELAKETVTMSPTEVETFSNKLTDISRLSEGIRSFDTKLKEFLDNPAKQSQELNKIDEDNAEKEVENKRSAIARRINFNGTPEEIAKALDENKDDIEAIGGYSKFISTLSPEEKEKIKAAQKWKRGVDGLKRKLDESALTDEEKRLASSLIDAESKSAKDIDEIGKNILRALNEGALTAKIESLVSEDEGVRDLEKIAKVEEIEARLKDFFDTSIEQIAKDLSKVEKSTEENLKSTLEAIEKKEKEEKEDPKLSDKAPKEAKEPELKVPTEEVAFTPEPGSITYPSSAKEVKSRNQQKAKEPLQRPKAGTLDPAFTSRPQISQFYLHDNGLLTYVDAIKNNHSLIPKGVDADAYIRYVSAVSKFLQENDAFNYVANTLSVGDTITFIEDEKLNEEAGVRVVLMSTKDASGNTHIIGSLPTSLDFQGKYPNSDKTVGELRPGQKALYEQILNSDPSQTTITTTVQSLRAGRMAFGRIEHSVASVFGEEVPVIAVLNESSTLTANDPKLDSRLNQTSLGSISSTAVPWSIYAMVPTNTGNYLPALCYSTPLSAIIGDPNDWYINETIKSIQNIPSSIADLKSNIQKVFKWIPVKGLSIAIGRKGNGNSFEKETSDVSKATHIRITYTNNSGNVTFRYLKIVNDGSKYTIDREDVRATLVNIIKDFPEMTTNVDIKRLSDRPEDREYRRSIAHYLHTNLALAHSVNDFFTYSPTDIEIKEAKKEQSKVDKKPEVKGDGNTVSIVVNDKTYKVTGTYVEDENGNAVSGDEKQQVLDKIASPIDAKPTESAKSDSLFAVFNREQPDDGQKDYDATLEEPRLRASKPNRRRRLAVSDTSESAASQSTIENNIERVKKMFPLLSETGRIVVVNGLIRTVDDAGNPIDAYGEFRDGVLYISSQSPAGTAYHEAFHYVTDLLLSKEDRAIMFNAAREKYGNMPEIQLEEKLSEDFRHFMNGFDDKSLVGRLKTFFVNLKHIIDGIFNRTNYLDNLFFDIYKSRISNRYHEYAPVERKDNNPLLSYVTTNQNEEIIKGELGVNKEQLISLLGSTMYKSNVQSVAVKELIQNAFDAVKIAKSQNAIKDARIDVEIDREERIIRVSDNGTGMSPQIVQKAFFTIGGSYKGENVDNRLKSGGLGLAKMAFLFSSEFVEVSTVKDGIKTFVRATPEDIQKDNFNLVTSRTSEPNGTTVTVKIPKYYLDENGEKKDIWFDSSPDFLDRPMIGDVTLNVTKKGGWSDRTTSSNKKEIPKGYTFIGKATSDFGDIEMYVAPADSYWIESEVLISGLHQFRHNTRIESNGRARFKAIINILPSVGVKSPTYPINNQREGFRSTVTPEVEDINYLLTRINNSLERKSISAAFGNSLSMDVGKVAEVKREISPEDILNTTIKEIQEEFTPTPSTTSTKEATLGNSIDLSKVRTAREDEKTRRSSLNTSGIKIDDSEISSVDTSNLDVAKPLFHNNTTMKIEEDGQKVIEGIGKLLLELKSLYTQTYKDTVIPTRFGSWREPVSSIKYIEDQFWGISFDKNYGGVNVSPTVIKMLAINPFYQIPNYPGIDFASALTEYITHLIIHEFNHNYASGEGSSFTGRFPATYAEFAGIGKQFNVDWKEKLRKLIKENIDTFIKYNERYNKSENLGDSFSGSNLTRTGESQRSSTKNDGQVFSWNTSREDVQTVSRTSTQDASQQFKQELIKYKTQELSYDNLDNETKELLEQKKVTKKHFDKLTIEDKENTLFCLI